MHKFKDATGKEWSLLVTIAAVQRAREHAGEDLLRFFAKDKPLVKELAEDPVRLVAVLYAVCRPQAVEAGITPEEFGERMYGDALPQATDALLGAMVDFSPHPKEREMLRRVLATAKRVSDRKADSITLPSEEEIEAAMTKAMSGGSSPTAAPG